MNIELTEEEQNKFTKLISEFIENRNIKTKIDWSDDFSKTNDLFELVLKVEDYLEEVSKYD